MDDIASIYFNALASILFDGFGYEMPWMPWWPINANKHKLRSINHRKKFLILSNKKQIKLKFKNA